MELVIGTPAWSSWSMRPWLALKRTGAPYRGVVIELRRGDDTRADILKHSPSGKVPLLKDGDLVVWDSLAICEYLAERFPEARLWPDDVFTRTAGRAAAAEMHSGFQALRNECPMDLLAEPQKMDLSEAVQADVRRIVSLWRALRRRNGGRGDFLLGDWSIADAFFAPVATRFRTYGVNLRAHGDDGTAAAYMADLLETPEVLAWQALAEATAAAAAG